MKHTFKTGSQILVVVAAVAILATAAFAYTNPTGTAPSGNVPAPVNTGSTMQTKLGDLGLAGTGTGNLFATMNGWFGGGVFAKQGIFTPGNIGFFVAPSNLLVVASSISPTIHGLIVNALGDTTISGNLAITSGSPAAGAVLTSDATGNATWQPGSATLPTLTGGGFDIKIIKNWGQTGGYAQANCNAGTSSNDPSAVPPGDSIPASGGYKLIGGGGACDDDTAHIQESRVDTDPQVNNNGWKVSCQKDLAGSASGTRVQAICMKYTAPILAVSTPTPTPATPLTQTSGVGSFGDSCIQTFGNHTYTARVHNTTGGSAVDTDLQNQCFYMKNSNPGLVTNCYPLPATGPTSNAILYQAVSSCGYSAGLGTYSGKTLFQ